MNFHQKVVFLHLQSMPFKIKQRKRGFQGEKLAKRGIETTAVTQKVQQKYIDIACKANFFPSLFETGS